MARFVALTLPDDEEHPRKIQVNVDQIRILRPQATGRTAIIFDEAHSILVEEDSDRIVTLAAD